MISKIELKNFMSHKQSVVELSTSGTVAVMGENGSGKSAFLESLPYAYYGLGRENLTGMSRINGDGSHKVTVTHDDGVVVSRGCKPSGTGFCTVHVEGDLKAKGKEAMAWIEDYLGMDTDTYMLTAFFGLRDVRHDPLINVTPAIRLETLQQIAKIGPYREFAKHAKAGISTSEMAYEKAKSLVEGSEAAMPDVAEIKGRLEDLLVDEAKYLKQIKVLKSKRHDLQIEEEAYQAMVKERTRLAEERRSVRRDVDRLEGEEGTYKSAIEINLDIFNDLKAKKASTEANLKSGADVDTLTSDVATAESERARLNTLASLRQTALNLDTDACPLCGASLAEETLKNWETEYKELKDSADDYRAEADDKRGRIRSISAYQKSLQSLISELSAVMEEQTQSEAHLVELARELRKQKDILEKLDNQFLNLSEKLGDEYQGLQSKMSEVSDAIDDANLKLGDTRGYMAGAKEMIQSADAIREKIKTAKAAVTDSKGEIAAYKLLQTAWSRYGIPMSLIKDIMQEIEDRATSVYSEFDSGQIEVREVEDRGKPGVQFFLIDQKGERTFNQLSEGEKVMFFVSVRVAIAQIVAESGVRVNYLILDEAMGNLSPRRRDDLIRLVNKVLRRLFPMVVMVSHTEMRDIFTQTVKVSAEIGESKVEVS